MPLLGISDTYWGKILPMWKSVVSIAHSTKYVWTIKLLASEDNKLIEDVEELYEIKQYKETTKMVQEVARKKNGQ